MLPDDMKDELKALVVWFSGEGVDLLGLSPPLVMLVVSLLDWGISLLEAGHDPAVVLARLRVVGPELDAVEAAWAKSLSEKDRELVDREKKGEP